jgi:hypothetical protein
MAEAFWKEKPEDEDWDRQELDDEVVPEFVAAVPRFKDDVEVLIHLRKGDKPLETRARQENCLHLSMDLVTPLGAVLGRPSKLMVKSTTSTDSGAPKSQRNNLQIGGS